MVEFTLLKAGIPWNELRQLSEEQVALMFAIETEMIKAQSDSREVSAPYGQMRMPRG